MRSSALRAALAAAGVAWSTGVSSLLAQEPAPAARPKIGIAFSGGGAKGAAHVGVLRVLEELRVPVDYAAGTSMGSIVGGLYAAGLTLEELEAALVDTDWADALVDTTNREQLQFRRKDDDLRFIPDLEFGVGRGGLKSPLGLRSGQKLNYLLHSLTLPVRTVRDFDELPIPFRAVATDISNGQPVVLSRGELARALRASMAIPTAFSPVEIDGRLLVDGGISNNVPVDVVRAMGADVVIAIDIGSPLLESDRVRRSFLTILNQTLGLITRGNMTPRLEQADIVITPAVSDYGTMQFDKSAEIIALGESEARTFVERLAPYALPEADYAAWKESRRRTPDPLPVLTEVRIEGQQRVDLRAIQPLVRARAGELFAPETARDDLARIFGLGDFENVDMALEPAPGGAALVYRLREKPWGPNYLRIGLNFEADFEGQNGLAVLGGLNMTRLNALGAEWKSDVQIGEERVFQTELYQPLSFENGWFVAPSVGYRRRIIPLFTEGDRVAEIDVATEYARFDLGYVFGRYGELRLGLERDWGSADRLSGVVPEDLEHFLHETIDRGAVTLRMTLDRLDNAKLPKRGWLARLEAVEALESLGSDQDYLRIEAGFDRYWTRSRHTVFGDLSAGLSPDGTLPVGDRFRLGGFFSLSGFAPGEISGDNYGVVRAGYYYRLTRLFHVGGYLEGAQVGDEPEDVFVDPIGAATALFVADTGAGPLYLAIGWADEGETTAFVVYGRRF
jgi:NTE family protein